MPYIGEITLFACGFAPMGYVSCNGQLMPIQQNPTLFSIIGTEFGGNGTTNFEVPNFAGVSPMSAGQGPGLSPRALGESGGETTVILNSNELAIHSHHPAALAGANAATPLNDVWSNPGNERPIPKFYASQMTNPQAMAADLIGSTGGGLGHNNLMPFLVTTMALCTQGEFPQRG